jgi:ribosomal protein L23
VTVEKVRIINVASHRRRHPRSRIMGHKAKQVVRKPGWKKALVKLVEGQRLELFEGV